MTVAAILAKKGRNVFSLSADTSVADVLSVLSKKSIGAVLIANNDDTVAGILSERDVVRALAENGAGILQDPASEHMTKNVVTCSENDAIASLMEQMSMGRFRHLPVLKDGKLAGVISIGDVVKMRIEQAEKEAEDIRSYISAV
jgi:CBS domain-containing protein